MAAGNFFDQFDAPAPAPAAQAQPQGGNYFDQFDAPPPSRDDVSADRQATVGRVAGLAGRAGLEGVGQLEDAPRNIAHAVDAGAVWLLKRAGVISPDYQLPTPDQVDQGLGTQSSTSAATQIANAANLPTPATPGERVYSAAVSALPSAVLAPEAPIAGALWGAAGGAASQATAEAGGGPLAQTLAGLAAGSLPAVGAGAAGVVRGLTRGVGADAAAATQARVANAVANNVPLTAGQATGSRFLQALETGSGNLWGGGPIHAAAEQQTSAIGTRVSDIVDKLNSGGASLTPTGAGEAINTGAAAAKGSMKAAESAAYAKVDQLVPATTPVDVSGTLGKLEALATPAPGAANTTAALVSPKIAALHSNLQADLQANGGNTIPYSAARALRTAVGNSIDWGGFAPSDPVTNGALKQVYGALGDDVNAGAAAVGPEASQAVSDASSLYAANSQKRELLNSIVDKNGGPEAVYQAATSGTKLGATKIAGVMDALDPQNANVVRATVLSRLGQARPGAADSTGSFNAATFLTNWNRLAPEAKDALFGAAGSGPSRTLRSSLDSLTQTVSTLRDAGHTLENPSGTGASLGHTFTLWGMLKHIAEGAAAVGVGAHEAGSEHALGAAVGSAGLMLGAAGFNNLAARILTNPRTAQWLATTTKLPPAALPNAVNQLSRMGDANNDPDARDLAAYLRARRGAQ